VPQDPQAIRAAPDWCRGYGCRTFLRLAVMQHDSVPAVDASACGGPRRRETLTAQAVED
jgi:hypothetical protein